MSSGDMYPRDFIENFEPRTVPSGHFVKDGRLFSAPVPPGTIAFDRGRWPPKAPLTPTGEEAKARKETPMARGLLDYFPDALAEVARVSFIGNEQHNPGEELHWAKEKSTDHADCIIRHLKDRGTMDTDNTRHSAKVAWRALALLQIELDRENSV